ncbi:hypothetical protein M271_00455 [Streptomyces rapamycinicus NRRL 5491]|nr:hypothetical protein M271_00455 [Streptomyces rapamycinicus NRRL 5491]
MLKDAFTLQDAQRLAHRRPADAQSGSESLLTEGLPRQQFHGKQHLVEPVDDFRDGSSPGRA